MISGTSKANISSTSMSPENISPENISSMDISLANLSNTNNSYEVMFEKYPDILSIKELQKALSIGRNTAYRLITDGRIKHLRVQGTIKIPKRFLIDFVLSSCYNNDSDKSAVTGG